VLGPFYLQWVVDQVLVSADRELLTVIGLGFGLLVLLQVGTHLLRGWAVVYLSTKLGLQWMGNVFTHLLRLPLDFFEKRHLGDVVACHRASGGLGQRHVTRRLPTAQNPPRQAIPSERIALGERYAANW